MECLLQHLPPLLPPRVPAATAAEAAPATLVAVPGAPHPSAKIRTTRAFLGICAFLSACPWRNTSIYRTVARGKVFERRGRVQCKRGCRAFRGAAYLPRGVETVFLHVPLLHLDIHVAYIILFSFFCFLCYAYDLSGFVIELSVSAGALQVGNHSDGSTRAH